MKNSESDTAAKVSLEATKDEKTGGLKKGNWTLVALLWILTVAAAFSIGLVVGRSKNFPDCPTDWGGASFSIASFTYFGGDLGEVLRGDEYCNSEDPLTCWINLFTIHCGCGERDYAILREAGEFQVIKLFDTDLGDKEDGQGRPLDALVSEIDA
mmetsp:Transcript_17647/g.33472  ORF Transcript_17647/g.33472 Transcript_17647/m.33472 type:complete len:155 (-) Transcript_17647:130-594(-)